MPELLECNPNNHYNTVYILKRKYEDYFSLVLINKNEINSDWKSYQNLLNIHKNDYDPYYNDNLFNFIDKISISNEWGYKIGEGLKYPNLGTKFKNLIIQYFRKEKLNKIYYELGNI